MILVQDFPDRRFDMLQHFRRAVSDLFVHLLVCLVGRVFALEDVERADRPIIKGG